MAQTNNDDFAVEVPQSRVKKKKRFYKKWWFYLTIIPIGLMVGGTSFAWHKYGPEVQTAIRQGYAESAKVTNNTLDPVQPTVIYGQNGSVLKQLNTKSGLVVTEKDANPLLSKGFVSVEDQRYYQNHGVDLFGTARAMVEHYIMHKPLQGGSTITQQVARDVVLHNQQQTASRKISEMVVAQQLDKKFSKDKVLTTYLNNSYFGHGATGVAAASQYYFGKNQKDLTPREAAVIISLTNNPTLYDPQTNPDISNKKVDVTLGTMYALHVINRQQYDEAVHQKTVLHITPLVNDVEFTDNYAVSYAVHNAAEAMAATDGFQFKYKFANDADYNTYHEAYSKTMKLETEKILGGGYKIYTTINPEIQSKVEDAVKHVMSPYQTRDASGKLQPQVAATVIDNQTHDVEAVIGGRGTDGDYLNRSFQSFRQTGSSAKPIVAYTPAFETGDRPQTNVFDGPLKEYPTVKDYGGNFTNKNISMRNAVVNSYNTPALRAAMTQPIDKITDKLAAMHFADLAPADNNYIIALGGFTDGASTNDMAGAYATLASNGVYTPQSNITKITNSATNGTIYENPHHETQVYSPSASYMMLDVMKSVLNGPTVNKNFAGASNYPLNFQAGKPGQSDNNKDSYYAYANYYDSSAVWVGNDNEQDLTESQIDLPQAVNQAIQNVVLAGKTPRDFDKPANVVKNGDDMSTNGPDQSLTDKNQEQLNQEKDRRAKAIKANTNRLDSQDYRIIYGLSKKTEQAREDRVSTLIDKVNNTKFDEMSQYADLQKELSEAASYLTDVKHAAAKKVLSDEINQSQDTLSAQYSYLQLVDKKKLKKSEQTKIDEAQKAALNKNQPKINSLENQLETDQNALLSAYKGTDTSAQSSATKAVTNDITQLNSLGKATPAVYVITDNQGNAQLINGPTPKLTMAN